MTITQQEMAEFNKMIEESICISNRDALKNKIHEIHNFLRNSGIGYGLSALKVFNILYGLKKIEDSGHFEKLGLSKKCKFSHLLDLANRGLDEEVMEDIFDIADDSVLSSLKYNEKANILFYEMPARHKGKTFSKLIKLIDSIGLIEEKSNVQLSGKIYEYFIGRDKTAISELGAYFTDRHIVNYIYDKIKPKIKDDGNIPEMVDMFGGSGGFTTGYINYLKDNYQIDWETQLEYIHHYDVNEDVIKSAALEFFCLTGVFPNYNNVRCKNSFSDDYDRQYDLIVTNPPYGGDEKPSEEKIKRDKIVEYIKNELKSLEDDEKIEMRKQQLKFFKEQEKKENIQVEDSGVNLKTCSHHIYRLAGQYNLKGNDKEACSLILMMSLLKEGGTAVGVLKEGVFFDSSYSDIRKHLLENYNVKEIISVPKDQFENTSTKTSIVIFENTKEKTNRVLFKELIVEKYKEDKFQENDKGYIILVENKGDISNIIERDISVATLDEILENPKYSLDGKDYEHKEIRVGDGYELVKLGDICKFLPKSKRQASYGKSEGKYNFYTSSDKIQKCDEADYDDEAILIGTGGNSCLHMVKGKFSCSGDVLLLTTKNIDMIYYSILCRWNDLIGSMRGSTIKHVTKEMLKSFVISIPKEQKKTDKWIREISKFYNGKIQKQERLNILEQQIEDKIIDIRENEECEEVELKDLCEFIKTGKNKTPDNKEGKLYPYYGTGDITGYTDYYLFEGKHILVARNGTIGNCFLVDGKFYPSDHIFVIKNIPKYNISFIFYMIKILSENIRYLSNGSTIKGITKENLSKIKINIPKDKKLLDELNPIFLEIDKLHDEIKQLDKDYKKSIIDLTNESMPEDGKVEVLGKPKREKSPNKEEKKENKHDGFIVEKIRVKRTKKSKETPAKENEENENKYTKESLTKMTITNLKSIAKELKIRGHSTFKSPDKDKLVDLILTKN